MAQDHGGHRDFSGRVQLLSGRVHAPVDGGGVRRRARRGARRRRRVGVRRGGAGAEKTRTRRREKARTDGVIRRTFHYGT